MTDGGGDCADAPTSSWNAIAFHTAARRSAFIIRRSAVGLERDARDRRVEPVSHVDRGGRSALPPARLLRRSAFSILVAKTIITPVYLRRMRCARSDKTQQREYFKEFLSLSISLSLSVFGLWSLILGQGECSCRGLRYVRAHLRGRPEVRGDYRRR